ncbi:MAG TPA: heparan-alpha-glucosaminide N-acetyltransferase domain-containing protein [Vicinamibacterales bacterium]|nr:heparan-alpha-glucosaminide N-acetyltransferase domain-containing protein [Vicinamibacterales bacterium]
MRRGYIDWLRGLAVLIMVEAHTLDAWTRAPDRTTPVFGLGGILGGFGAPLFLFLAGVAVPLAVDARMRRGADLRSAARAVQRRGWEVYGLAFLFRLQAKLLGGGAWSTLLRVDILNIMGPAIAIAAAIVGWTSSGRVRVVVLGAMAVLAGIATPFVRNAAWPSALPDFVEAYLRPVPSLTNFVLFPWAGFLAAGAVAGVLLARATDAHAERRLNLAFLVSGALLAGGAFAASFLPSAFPPTYFWTSSPAFFALRVGILLLLLPLSFAWNRLRDAVFASRSSFMQQFGRTSLFVYWIHVEMVYGRVSDPLHRSLSLWQWAAAYVLFTAFLSVLSVVKSWVASRWHRRRDVAPRLERDTVPRP